jgi:hypothetical protein
MNKRIAIIHYQPVEVYPPMLNVLNAICEAFPGRKIKVFTTALTIGLDWFVPPSKDMEMKRTTPLKISDPAPLRMLHYIRFYLGSLLSLIRFRPDTVIYYESISAFPALIYKRFVNRKARLFIHYHEYTTKAEYQAGMQLVNRFHRMELAVYPRANWLSHTNEDRMQQFKADYPGISWPPAHIFPNYPPRSWIEACRMENKPTSRPVRFVYVGALSNITMYCREFCEWILQMEGAATLELYAHNVDHSAREFLDSLETPYIREKGGVNYFELPSVMRTYDVGVILYRGLNPNFVYNAPNKLFEYLACGLDVWFPEEMIGCHAYETSGTRPQVIRMDFKHTENWQMEALLPTPELKYKESVYFCENAIAPLVAELNGE